MSTLASADYLKVGYVIESSRGTTPATPAIQELRKTGLTVNPNNRAVESGEIVTGGRLRDMIFIGQEPSLTLPIELSRDSYTDQLAHGLRGTWVKTPEKLGPTALTGVATAGVFSVASGGTAYIAGHIVRSTGWTTTANNAVGNVTASTGTTVTTDIATANETASSTARLKVIGIKALANGGISFDGTQTFTIASINPTIAGLAPGVWFEATGFTASSGATNGWYRVYAIFGSGPWTVVCDFVQPGAVNDTASGVKAALYFNDYVRDTGTTVSTATYEVQASEIPLYRYVKGAGVSGLTLDFPPNAVATGSFDVMGLTATPWSGTRVSGATDLAATTSDVMNTAAHVARVADANVAFGAALVTRFGMRVTNELRRLPAVATVGTADFQLGQFRVQFPLEMYLDATVTPGLSAKYVAATATSFDFRTVDGLGYGYVFDAPKAKYSEGDNTSAARNSTMTVPFTCSALEFAPFSGAKYTVHCQRVEPKTA
jgi:hypothetical protein